MMKDTIMNMPKSFMAISSDYNTINKSIQHLDFYSRILIGQDDRIPEMMGCSVCSVSNYSDIREPLLKIRKIFIPNLNKAEIYASNGIWSPDSPERAIKAYDIQQALRFQMSWYGYMKKENAKYSPDTVNFEIPYFHGNWDVTEDEVEYCHAVLQMFGYPEWQNGCSLTRRWSFPCVIAEFFDVTGTIRLEMRRNILHDEAYPEIIRIMRAAQKVYLAVQKSSLVEIFEILYPELDLANHKGLLQKTEKIIKEVSEFEKSKYGC